MVNLLMEYDIVGKLTESGIVILLGVLMVFLILAFLIGVVKLLKYVNDWMGLWDRMMARNRAKRKEIKNIKLRLKSEYALAVDAVNNSDEADKKAAKAQLKEEYKKNLEAAKPSIDAICEHYAAIALLDKERDAAIKSARAEEAAEFKNAKAENAEDAKAKRVIARKELNAKIKGINAEYDAKIGALGKETVAENVSDAEDDAIIAVISAAVAMMTAVEAQTKNVKFRVRSIKEIR